MAVNFDFTTSNLECTENSSICFENGFSDVSVVDDNMDIQNHIQDSISNRSFLLMGFFSFESEDMLREIAVKETELLPKDDYLIRLRTGDLNSSVRREAIDWILKAHAHYQFGPLSFCLSINYLDRFLSVYELPRYKDWITQLLAVTCLLLAAKMEETEVPPLVELQVGEPNYLFESKSITKMEVLVLGVLKWRMQCLTPFSFIDYFLTKISGDQRPSATAISRSIQLICRTIEVIDFLEFKPSEIAAAVAISLLGEDMQAQNLDKAISCFIHVERVLKCVKMIEDMTSKKGSAIPSFAPVSPDGVPDAECLNYTNRTEEDTTVWSCTNGSSHTNV